VKRLVLIASSRSPVVEVFVQIAEHQGLQLLLRQLLN
jgi:hypothetical protein